MRSRRASRADYAADQQGSRIYATIYIRGDPDRSTRSYGSEALFDTELSHDLISKASEWELSVNKFRIDTRSIPLTIAEISDEGRKRRPVDPGRRFETEYEFNKVELREGDFPQRVDGPYILKYECKNPGLFMEEVPHKVDKTNEYYDNTDPYFWIFNYQDVIDMLNQPNASIEGRKATSVYPYFYADPGTQIVKVKYDQEAFDQTTLPEGENPTVVLFSEKLYKYIGKGYNCGWIEFEGENYFYHNVRSDVFPVNADGDVVIQPEYSDPSSWEICQSILIGDTNLPIVPEKFPKADTAGDLGRLTHGKEEQELMYRDALSENVLTVFYPNSSKAGDMRTSLFYSSTNMDNGDKVTLINDMPIRQIKLSVKWTDIYGNIYPLLLGSSSIASIRLCFTRKCKANSRSRGNAAAAAAAVPPPPPPPSSDNNDDDEIEEEEYVPPKKRGAKEKRQRLIGLPQYQPAPQQQDRSALMDASNLFSSFLF